MVNMLFSLAENANIVTVWTPGSADPVLRPGGVARGKGAG